jgi:hypothetical protein
VTRGRRGSRFAGLLLSAAALYAAPSDGALGLVKLFALGLSSSS